MKMLCASGGEARFVHESFRTLERGDVRRSLAFLDSL
jgi:hypothetical protein